MKHVFKVKKIDMESGGKNIAILNEHDAKDMGVMHLDRIKILTKNKEQVAVLDLTKSLLKSGYIGVFDELAEKLKLKNDQQVEIEPIERPESVIFIKKKLDGETLTGNQINTIIKDVVDESLSEVELAAFVVACYTRGLDEKETIALTNAIVDSGEKIKFSDKKVFDKHSVGGVPGNRTTMIIVPIIAAAGLKIPKTSSRAITSPSGTADTMEVLCPVALSKNQIIKVVNQTNGCIVWGGGVNLAAADDKLIKIRNPLKLDPPGMLLASILAKKKSVGATDVLIDISIGKGAKIKDEKEGKELATMFMELGTKLKMNIECILTPGYDPIGSAVGPALEAREVLRILEGKPVSYDLKEKAISMTAILLEMGGKPNPEKMAKHILESGQALKKFKEIIKAQGGNPNITSDKIKIGKYSYDYKAPQDGRIHYLNTNAIAAIARVAGAPQNKGAGIYLYYEKGDKITKDSKVFTIYAESQRKLDEAKKTVNEMPPIEFEKVILEEYTIKSLHRMKK